MIITKIRLQEEHPMVGETKTWPLPYCDFHVNSLAGTNGYILKASVGLGPPDFISVVEGFDNFGTPIMDSVPQTRDIAFRIGFLPGIGQTVGELRDELYKYISRSVLISLMNGSRTLAQMPGFVKRVETLHFSNQPEVQLTVECRNGEFAAPTSVPLVFEDLYNAYPIISYEEGNAPTGLDLKFKYIAVATGTGFTISGHSKFWHSGDGEVFNEFTLTYPLQTNDEITISTHRHNKRITLLRGASTYDLAGYINAGAVWPKLYPGVNSFEWTFSDVWMEWMSASYTPRFWGV